MQCGAAEPKCNYCLGCGQQAWFQGCADIAIMDTAGSHPAVRGVRTQQEVRAQWERTLRDLKGNCSCGGPGAKPSDNSINASYPLPASTASPLSSSTAVPRGLDTHTHTHAHDHTAPHSHPRPPTHPDSSLKPTHTDGSHIKPHTHPGPRPTHPGGHGQGAQSPPFFNPHWGRPPATKRPPTTTTTTTTTTTSPRPAGRRRCYVPYRAPWYLLNAREWCARNCPRRGAACHFRACRPVTCRPRRPRGQQQASRGHDLRWLLPLLLMDSFEL